ncbi:MAG: type III polyketide synthase [Bacteroidetes bacterium]|nr:type III polyketide synthase [Bacteroidota bacterium]HET6244115.1 type III polyketide synthase [Bacteroidia bacterium]
MSNITAISALCGEFPVNHFQMKDYLDSIYEDKMVIRKYKALLKDDSIRVKNSVIPDFQPGCKSPALYKPENMQPGTAERMRIYEKESARLGFAVSEEAISKAGLQKQDITHIITVSCTGFSAPGLETLLLEKLELNYNVKRFTVNFMGCYAAFHGLRLADLICKSEPSAKVLLVCVELCSLHFRKDISEDNILSTYLFSDGAAACIVRNDAPVAESYLSCYSFDSLLIPEGKNDMGWNIGNNGFEMILSRDVPGHIENHIAKAFNDFISRNGLLKEDIAYYAIHPGGKNILKAFERALILPRDKLAESYEILQNYGNMSSATILFVLQKFLEKPDSVKQGEWLYSAAFGPGLTVESGLFKITRN